VRRETAYYAITWSPLEPVSRRRINAAVPSMPGIWELYYLKHARIPQILKLGAAWRGGVRHRLRFEADAEQIANRDIRDLLETGDCYYRYTICEIRDDLIDVYSVLQSLRGTDGRPAEPSGRYGEVRIREPEEMVIRRSRVPGESRQPPESFGREVPNMFDVVREMRALEAEQAEQAEQAGGAEQAEPATDPPPQDGPLPEPES
jgi:hypothetical protein